MSKSVLHIPCCLLAALCLLGAGFSSCSTTANLPEDEQLYTGIKEIDYQDKPVKFKAGRDSVGVITSIGRAVQAVDALLDGRGTGAAGGLSALESDSLRAADLEAAKARREADIADFENVKEEVDAVLAYPPNNAIFGSSRLHSPIQPGLWFYNGLVNSGSKLGKWMFRTFSTQPVLVSTVSPDMRAKVATNTLHNYGYFRGRVDYELVPGKNPRKARIAYHVHAGPLFRLDSVAYLNFGPVTDSLLRATFPKRLLRKGDAFSVVNLAGEQTRIEGLLRENGYYFFSAPYTTFRADTLQRPGLVQLQVRPADNIPARAARRWYIGTTYVSVREADNMPLEHTMRRRNYVFSYSGEKIPLRPSMWRHAITHRYGELYKLSMQNSTLEKLNGLGVFSQLDVNYVPRDTSGAASDTLDIYVTAVMDKLYDSSFEMNATLKSNQQVGPGVSFGLAKRNAFRGGEKISFKVFGSYEWQTGAGSGGGNSLLNSYELGTQLAFDFPRFVFPFIQKRYLRFPASTTFSVDADWKNRAGFFNMVSMGVSARYKWHKRPTAQHELTLLSLDFDKLMHTTQSFDSIMNANPALYISMRDQFIPSISYTFNYASAARHRNPVWLQLSAKEAGNLVSGIYAAAGKGFSQVDKKIFGSPFAQFVKATAELHTTFRLTQRMHLATRVFGGVVYSYGNSRQAPYAEQFYVGGANSVRAFTVRTVGPGSFRSPDTKYAYMDQMGDFKLEANAELRMKLFGNLHGAVFLDAGNVWLLREDPQRPGGHLSAKNLKYIAVGTGAGLRYDLSFLVLRFDVGVALHAPYETGKSGWYNVPRFKDGLAYHFAIGYPF